MTPTSSSYSQPSDEQKAPPLGEIKINLHVVGQIVRLTALRIDGVAEVGNSGIGNTIAGMFSKSKKDTTDRGVRITEDEQNGGYHIDIDVMLDLGAELVNVAYRIQEAVHSQVTKMTNKPVNAVNVIIDGVKQREGSDSRTDSSASDG